jgi:6-phosphogluconolactonase
VTTDVELAVVPDAEAAAREVAERLAAAARRGGHIAFSGGSTPRRAYQLAVELEPDWSGVDAWLGDERCVPPDDERANVRLVRETIVAGAGKPPVVHPVDTALLPDEAAGLYHSALIGVGFELVLLGLGSDGHTASLFPDAPVLDEREALAVAAEPGLEPFVERVTMTIPALSTAREVLFLAVGADKADAARRAFAEPPSPSTPASLVRAASGTTVAVFDRAAAAQLE